MRVLVTGAAGFLGRWFVARHVQQGDEVWGLDNMSNPLSRWPDELDKKHQVWGDAATFVEELARANWMPQTFDLAYHFAAPVGGRVKIEKDPLFNADSLRLDAAFFRWATKDTVGTAIYPSSSAVYPAHMQGEDGAPLSELLFQPKFEHWGKPDEMYGFTKMAGEVLAHTAARVSGLNVLCIRPFSGYGPDQGLDYPIPAITQRVARHEQPIAIWGGGNQTRDFVYITDVVGATLARVPTVVGFEAMNIGTGIETSFRDVAEILIRNEQTRWPGWQTTVFAQPGLPQGVSRRVADVREMNRWYAPDVALEDGLDLCLRYRLHAEHGGEG